MGEEHLMQPESITCPVCGRTSAHPADIREGYCGNCHDWTSPPAGERLRRAREQAAADRAEHNAKEE